MTPSRQLHTRAGKDMSANRYHGRYDAPGQQVTKQVAHCGKDSDRRNTR